MCWFDSATFREPSHDAPCASFSASLRQRSAPTRIVTVSATDSDDALNPSSHAGPGAIFQVTESLQSTWRGQNWRIPHFAEAGSFCSSTHTFLAQIHFLWPRFRLIRSWNAYIVSVRAANKVFWNLTRAVPVTRGTAWWSGQWDVSGLSTGVYRQILNVTTRGNEFDFRWLSQPAWCALRIAPCSRERLQPDRSPATPVEPQSSEIFVSSVK